MMLHLPPSSYHANGSYHSGSPFTVGSVLLPMSNQRIQGKFHNMRSNVALISKIAAMSLMLAYGSAWAQDVAPETPPELRDFRLDPQPARPTPQPSVETGPATPPPAVSTVPDTATTAPRTSSPAVAPRRRETPQPAIAPPVDKALAGDVELVPPVVSSDEPADDLTSTAMPEQPSESVVPAPSLNWWPIAAASGLIGMLLVAAYLFRRSRKRPLLYDDTAELAAAAAPPRADPVVADPPLLPPVSKSKPRVTIDFIPEKASISFTALTIKGELRVINESDSPAKDMQLRAALISASAHQDSEIAAFHSESADTPGQNLGDAEPRERIGMVIELAVPLADLQSFPLGAQKLFVPLMIANISYDAGDATSSEIAKIACMIGREATPPKPKMAPFRLDLGPRSFSPLGQRSVVS